MISEKNLVFSLNTTSTTYMFRVNETKSLEHLYYGRRLRNSDNINALIDKHSKPTVDAVIYDEEEFNLSLDNICLEYSFYGKGDYRELPLLFSRPDGNRVADFTYKSHRIFKGKNRSFSGLPESHGHNTQCSTLIVTLEDKINLVRLELSYTAFTYTDVIVRKAALINDSNVSLQLNRFASVQLDLPHADFDLITLDGATFRERQINSFSLRSGTHINDSKTMTNSARHNSAIFLKEKNSDSCYGCNLIYSSDHAQYVEVSPYNKVRLLSGFNPATFSWQLKAQEKLHTPEAILTYSHLGLNGVSVNFQRFVNTNIISGKWQFHQRPIFNSTWEAKQYKFNESSLLSMAKAAAKVGIELFILDDGWFGGRDDNSTSLGDWSVNTKKLPDGLASFVKKLHDEGLMVGLWCEFESINLKSQLYREKSEWVIKVDNDTPLISNNRYILDLSRQDVRDYLFEQFSNIWRLAQIDYVRWDFKRTFSDMFFTLKESSHDEFSHRYILGLYDLLNRFVTTFPNILFEADSSNGNRFDLGILAYVSQIVVSENYDVLDRFEIQQGTSCAYPLSTQVNLIAPSINPITLRSTNIESAFNVAAFGVLGYSLDFSNLPSQTRKIVENQIAFYKQHRSLFQFGELYQIENSLNRGIWAISNNDQSEMIILYFQKRAIANPPSDILRIPLVDPELTYAVAPRKEQLDIKLFKTLSSQLSSVKIKEDGKLERIISETIKFESELEYYIVEGDVLAYHGIKLNQQFTGKLYDRETRILGDYGSRLYHIKALRE
jgi:alpha-galactosidase